jgi:hypothetical protein
MNLMMLKRFRNEIIVFIAIIFAIWAFYFKISSKKFVMEEKNKIVSSINEINQINEIKKLWKSKSISKKANRLRTIVSRTKVKFFKKSNQKVIITYRNLNARELNLIIKYVMNKPFIIKKLKIDKQSKDNYTMELVCRW